MLVEILVKPMPLYKKQQKIKMHKNAHKITKDIKSEQIYENMNFSRNLK